MVSRGGHDWRRDVISRDLPALDRSTLRGKVLTNVALTLVANDEQFSFSDAARGFDEAVDAFGTPLDEDADGHDE